MNPWSTFIAFLLISFGYNLVITAGNAMIIDASNAENRKVVFMLDYWAQNLSVILGAALSAWLFRPAFEALLVILLLTVLVSFFLTTFVMTETFRPIVKAKEEAENIFQAYKTVLQDKTYMILWVLILRPLLLSCNLIIFCLFIYQIVLKQSLFLVLKSMDNGCLRFI